MPSPLVTVFSVVPYITLDDGSTLLAGQRSDQPWNSPLIQRLLREGQLILLSDPPASTNDAASARKAAKTAPPTPGKSSSVSSSEESA